MRGRAHRGRIVVLCWDRPEYWLLSGRLVDAAEALSAGLVSRVVPAAEVLGAAQDYARELVTRTSPRLRIARKAAFLERRLPDFAGRLA